MTTLMMVAAGAIGALARFELASSIARRARNTSFPLGTLGVNAVGSLAAGWVFATNADPMTIQIVATGFLGGFTTFSTWMTETSNLAEEGGSTGLAVGNIAMMLIVGLAGAWLGMASAR